MKTYELTLSSDYCSNWTIQDALRDLYQNAVDQGSHWVDYDEEESKLYIGNSNSKIPPEFLLMGGGDKSNDNTKRGGFGEGFKIAFLVACREDYPLSVRNGDVEWEVYYEWSERFNSYTLNVYEKPSSGNSVVICIGGIDKDIYEEFIDRTLDLQDDVDVLYEDHLGNQILGNQSGKLYCSGLYVCDTQSPYGYNLHHTVLKLNRDRNRPADFDLNWETKNLWSRYTAENEDAVEPLLDLIHKNKSEVKFLTISDVSNAVKSKAYEKIKEKYGADVIMASSENSKEELKSLGYSNIKVVNGMISEIAMASKDYQIHLEESLPEESEERDLNDLLLSITEELPLDTKTTELIEDLFDLLEYKDVYLEGKLLKKDIDNFIKQHEDI